MGNTHQSQSYIKLSGTVCFPELIIHQQISELILSPNGGYCLYNVNIIFFAIKRQVLRIENNTQLSGIVSIKFSETVVINLW